MGQKSILLTLRKNKNSNLVSLQYKNFIYPIVFLKYLKKLFHQKKIFLINSSFNLVGNQTVLSLQLFFQTVRINKFKRNILFSKKKIIKFQKFLNIHSEIFSFLKTNLIFLNVVNFNKYIDKSVFLRLFFKFKKYHNILFPRRFNFFIDFIKISVLFLYSKVNVQFYIEILGQIFKILPKRRHNLFLSFVELFFNTLIMDFQQFNVMSLNGIKFMLCGRITAKPRAKFKYFQVGKIPAQSIEANIQFSKLHVYTFYGVFGLKIWTYRSETL